MLNWNTFLRWADWWIQRISFVGLDHPASFLATCWQLVPDALSGPALPTELLVLVLVILIVIVALFKFPILISIRWVSLSLVNENKSTYLKGELKQSVLVNILITLHQSCFTSLCGIKYVSPPINPLDTLSSIYSVSLTHSVSRSPIFPPSLLPCVFVRCCSMCRDRVNADTNTCSLKVTQNLTTQTYSHMRRNTHKTSYLLWQDCDVTYSSSKLWKRSQLALSYTLSTHRVDWWLPCIIHTCNLKTSWKVVLCSSVCLHVSLTHRSAGKESSTPGLFY